MTGALQGKVIWVTGAGSGIGAAAARALAREGATVVLTGRRSAALGEVAETIRGAGGRARVLPGDLANAATAAELAQRIDAEFARLDILVNNAGTNIPARAWDRLTAPGLAEVLDGNLASAFHTVMAVLPIMRRQRDGVMIHTASIAGLQVTSQPGPAYTAAKHGVVALSHSLNVEELANGIRSTALCPGEVATPIIEKRPEATSAEQLARMLRPEDVADVIVYVAMLPPRVCLSQVTVVPGAHPRA
jgi:NAD(P)-dependent dehydrogenase (short-subunit alcohol dehydrogenase family)